MVSFLGKLNCDHFFLKHCDNFIWSFSLNIQQELQDVCASSALISQAAPILPEQISDYTPMGADTDREVRSDEFIRPRWETDPKPQSNTAVLFCFKNLCMRSTSKTISFLIRLQRARSAQKLHSPSCIQIPNSTPAAWHQHNGSSLA